MTLDGSKAKTFKSTYAGAGVMRSEPTRWRQTWLRQIPKPSKSRPHWRLLRYCNKHEQFRWYSPRWQIHSVQGSSATWLGPEQTLPVLSMTMLRLAASGWNY